MRVLLDESLPRPFATLLAGYEVRTVTEMKWTSLGNGELLRVGADHFDAVLTADQNLAVVVLVAVSNRLQSLQPLLPELLRVLEVLQPRTLVRVGA